MSKFNPQRVIELGQYAQKKGIYVVVCQITDLQEATRTCPLDTVICYKLTEDIIDQVAEGGNNNILFHLEPDNHAAMVKFQTDKLVKQYRKIQWQRALHLFAFLTLVFLGGMVASALLLA